MVNKKFKVRVIIRKNGQPVIFPGKKNLKISDPTIKFGEDLFVKLEVVRRMK